MLTWTIGPGQHQERIYGVCGHLLESTISTLSISMDMKDTNNDFYSIAIIILVQLVQLVSSH